MTTHNFTYEELFTFGWEKTKYHFWFLLGVIFINLILVSAASPLSILGFITSVLLKIAVIYLMLLIVDNHVPSYKDMLVPFRTYKVFLHFVLGSLLYALTVLVGLILLVLPGIYLLVRLQFFAFLVIENENMSVMNSFKRSMEMTRGKFWKLFGFLILFILINIVGALLLVVGLLFTIPMTMLAYTLLYRKLSGAATHNSHPVHQEGSHLASI